MANESIAMCCNVYNDVEALRGLLECSSRFFDNLFIVHSGPGGAYSTDGTIELCEKFGATIVFDDIDKGFGVIRSRLIHDCGCTFAFILDADERFHPQLEMLHCDGTESYPQVQEPKLSVFSKHEVINQGAMLRRYIAHPDVMAIRSTRRHWFDFSFKRPTQNWLLNSDHQLRIIRNIPELGYATDVKMHEQMIDSRTGRTPVYAEQDHYKGIFHDHYHMFFRTKYPGHKEFNEANYTRLSNGEKMLVK